MKIKNLMIASIAAASTALFFSSCEPIIEGPNLGGNDSIWFDPSDTTNDDGTDSTIYDSNSDSEAWYNDSTYYSGGDSTWTGGDSTWTGGGDSTIWGDSTNFGG